jgi:hypothetical protein
VVKQVYRVKFDGHEDKSSDLNAIIEKPITLLKNPAIDGKEVKNHLLISYMPNLNKRM